MEIFLSEHAEDCQFGGLVHFFVANVGQCYAQWAFPTHLARALVLKIRVSVVRFRPWLQSCQT